MKIGTYIILIISMILSAYGTYNLPNTTAFERAGAFCGGFGLIFILLYIPLFLYRDLSAPTTFSWDKIKFQYKLLIIGLIAFLFLSFYLNGDYISIVAFFISLLLGVGWFGRWCWNGAYKHGRNTTWAYAWGLFFGFPGVVLYGIYLLFFKEVDHSDDTNKPDNPPNQPPRTATPVTRNTTGSNPTAGELLQQMQEEHQKLVDSQRFKR